MAQYNIEKITCPHCKKRMKIKVYDLLETNKEPKLKQKIIHGTFFDTLCPNCGSTVTVTYDLDYYDPKSNAFIVFAESDDYYLDTLSQLKEMREGKEEFDSLVYEAIKQSRFRIVRNEIELAEKALIFDLDLDDRIIEIIKRIQMALEEDKEEKPDDLIFNIGYYTNGEQEMCFLPVYDGEIREDAIPISDRLYELTTEEFEGPLSAYESDNFRINRKWIDEFLEYKAENFPEDKDFDDEDEEDNFEKTKEAKQIYQELNAFFDNVYDEEAFVAYGKRNWFPLFERILTYWYTYIDDEKPEFFDLDYEFDIGVSDLIQDLEMYSGNCKEHEFRMQICQSVLNNFDLENDALTFHNMKRFYAESLEEVQGIEARKTYLDAWAKEEPGNAYVIATLIDFYSMHNDYEKALELAEKYLYMEVKDYDDAWLYDACENLYLDLGNKAKVKEIQKLRTKSLRRY